MKIKDVIERDASPSTMMRQMLAPKNEFQYEVYHKHDLTFMKISFMSMNPPSCQIIVSTHPKPNIVLTRDESIPEFNSSIVLPKRLIGNSVLYRKDMKNDFTFTKKDAPNTNLKHNDNRRQFR
ncbi:hypothetical protein vseg_014240 [Gypsophila vaccaria]